MVNRVHNLTEAKALIKGAVRNGSVHEWDGMRFETHDGEPIGQLHVKGMTATLSLAGTTDFIEFK